MVGWQTGSASHAMTSRSRAAGRELRLRLHRFRVADEVHGAPVAERDRRRDEAADEADLRVDRSGAALPVGLLQLPVVAEERGDEHRDHDAHGEQNEQSGEARRGQANAVDDLLAHLSLEDGHSGRLVSVAGRVVEREGQIDGRDDLVADLDADVGASRVPFVRDAVRALRPAPRGRHFELADVLNVVPSNDRTMSITL